MIHRLKIWPQYYCRVADGSKTFEVRKNDRGYQPGDVVVLREFDPNLRVAVDGITIGFGDYTSTPALTFKIGHVMPIDAERVVFSILPMEQSK